MSLTSGTVRQNRLEGEQGGFVVSLGDKTLPISLLPIQSRDHPLMSDGVWPELSTHDAPNPQFAERQWVLASTFAKHSAQIGKTGAQPKPRAAAAVGEVEVGEFQRRSERRSKGLFLRSNSYDRTLQSDLPQSGVNQLGRHIVTKTGASLWQPFVRDENVDLTH